MVFTPNYYNRRGLKSQEEYLRRKQAAEARRLNAFLFVLPVRLGTRFFNRRLIQHFLRHNTLRFVHSFLRRRHPPISTPVFTCHPARPTILRTTTSCSRHHLHRFHRSRLDLNTIRRLWCLSVRDAT